MKLKQYRVRYTIWFKGLKRKHKIKLLGMFYLTSLFANFYTLDSLIISIALTALFLVFTRK